MSMSRDEIGELRFIRTILYTASTGHLNKALLEMQVNLAVRKLDALLLEKTGGDKKAAEKTTD